MDKIFKNDTIMGIVALATLALVAVMYFQNKKNTVAISTSVPAEEE